jgi:hypothetical protein
VKTPQSNVRAVVWALLLSFGGAPPGPRAQEKSGPGGRVSADAGAVEIQMRNVNFRLTRDIALEVRSLRGQLRRTNPEVPVTFDDSETFFVRIDTAEVATSADALAALMNSYVLAYDGAPFKNITVSINGDRVIQKGTLHKGLDLPFEIEGSLSATVDGNIRVHADRVKSAHVPVKGLLHLLGEDLSKLVNENSGRGMTIVGDDIILMPRTLTPPPHLEGRVTRVCIVNGKIIQFFDSGRHSAKLTPPLPSVAYIYHRGGILRFGKLTMNEADLEIVGDRPGFFEFFLREYRKQLAAGYSKTTPADGLIAHMADYSRLRGMQAGRVNRTSPR